MTEHENIIDVTPIRHSSSRITFGESREARNGSAHTGSRPSAGQDQADGSAKKWSPSGALAGLVQMAVGAGLVAIGIPMLILPGPGLLSIGAGVLLAARGLSKVTGR